MKKRVVTAVMLLAVISLLLVGCQRAGTVQNANAPGISQPAQISQPAENIGQTEAINTVKNMIDVDSQRYKIELVSDDLKYNGREYFQFRVSDRKGTLEPTVIVSKENGAVYCYYPDQTVTEMDQDALFKSMVI